MKPIVPILGVISALWLFLGTAWLSNKVCSTPVNSFQITDGTFKTSAKDMFMFPISSDDVLITEETKSAFKKIALHLENNPEKQLSLAGLFNSEEKNTSAFDNLGIARAEKIKFILSDLGADENRIQTSANEVNNLYFFPLDDKMKMFGGVNFLINNEGAGETTEESEPTSKAEDNATDSEPISTAIGAPLFLEITEVSSSFTKEEDFKNYFFELKDYLKNNPEKGLIVTCYNDDSTLAKNITKKVKRVFQKNGLATTNITRKTGKITDSPEGKSGVNIVVI